MFHTFYRDTLKNTFNIHVLVGQSEELFGKRISIDIGTLNAGIPSPVFDSTIERPTVIDRCEIEGKEKILPILRNKEKSDFELTECVDVRQLSELFFKQEAEIQMMASLEKQVINTGGNN